jgi:hypothetical protein
MPIVAVIPSEGRATQQGLPIFVDSDAEDNLRAIREIERWCRERGLARAQESYLRQLRTEHGLVHRGICYRPPSAETERLREIVEEMEHRVDRMPETRSSVELSREE